VWQRCLPTGANKIGISDRCGLRAGRKRHSTENDDKQLNDIPGPSGRDGARFNGDVRALGTIDGRHVASLIRAPSLNPTRNEGRTVAGRDQARHQLVDFHSGVIVAQQLAASSLRYFSEVLIELNLVLRFEPRPLTATMIAIEIPAAIRPYSMAVAPVSSDKNFNKARKSASY
jgi:hypothetical protein